MKTKFGDIVCRETPVLVCFYAEWNDVSSRFISVLRQASLVLGDSVKIFKFDVDQNKALVDALSVEALPTFMFYSKGVLQWRSEQNFTADELIDKLMPKLNINQ